MKKYITVFVLLILSAASCRKGEPLPKVKFFKSGQYHYDLFIANQNFENYHRMVIGGGDAANGNVNVVLQVAQFQNYTLPYFDSMNENHLMPIFTQYDYMLRNAGLYELYSDGGFLSLSTDNQDLLFPTFEMNLSEIKRTIYCNSEPRNMRYVIEHNKSIIVRGKEHSVYIMTIEPQFDCQGNRKQVIYVDNTIGIVRYELFGATAGQLLYRLDFNHFVPAY